MSSEKWRGLSMWKPMLFMGKVRKGKYSEGANNHIGKRMPKGEEGHSQECRTV